MSWIDVEAGPWGGFVLIVFVVLAAGAIYFSGWLLSGILLALVVVLPVCLFMYFTGRRIGHYAIHGRRRRR